LAGSKHPDNPILAEEPPNIHVTGFRDPFLAPWPALDRARGCTAPSLYGLISGGVHSDGPKTFLYEIAPTDLTRWTYLYPLAIDVPSNHRPGGRWGGDFGVNWECTNFVTLEGPDGIKREIVIAGSEGGLEQAQVTNYHESHPNAPHRSPSYANWFFGDLVPVEGDMRLNIGASGVLDWGLFYAANHFRAADGRKLLWGWIKEEDLDDRTLASRGWTGCLGIVRELYLQVTEGVTGGLRSNLDNIGSVDCKASGSGSQVTTLGIRPFAEIEQLRQPTALSWTSEIIDSTTRLCLASTSLTCETKIKINVEEDTRSVSLMVRHDSVRSTFTTITFDCVLEQLVVDRSHSTTREDINTAPDVGAFTLFRRVDSVTGSSEIEPLELDVFLDHDMLEVFANGRFALATRVYTDATSTGISIACDGPMTIEQLDIWPLKQRQ
jgi:beta-fructofuranosidase